MNKREIILIVGILSFLVLIVSLSLLLADKFQVKDCGCPKMVSQNFVLLFISLAVVFVVCLLYYLFSLRIDEKEKCIGKNLEILDSILDKDEKNVLDKLILNKGEIEQAILSKDYDKIKAHRIIKKLESKQIIDVIKKGKTNKIKLKRELYQSLKK